MQSTVKEIPNLHATQVYLALLTSMKRLGSGRYYHSISVAFTSLPTEALLLK